MNVRFYETADGKAPAREFISSQNAKMRTAIYRRAQAEGNAARVMYFFIFGGEAILTNGFVKKTPKTPASELELAKKYRADFLERQED